MLYDGMLPVLTARVRTDISIYNEICRHFCIKRTRLSWSQGICRKEDIRRKEDIGRKEDAD